MFLSILTEFIGTFVFLTVILKTNDALAIGLTLAGVIYFGGKVSGGNYNPAVSYMMYLNKKLDLSKFLLYILAQIVGASSALLFHNFTK
tara:strand:+ start:201 stop:467 length:267 start_codon:yes stop_codon:yes gene_type:complete